MSQTAYTVPIPAATGLAQGMGVTTGTTARQVMLPRGVAINIQGTVTPTVQRPVVWISG